jgi:hypothetical protein
MENKEYFKEFIVGVGFVTGLLYAIRIDPIGIMFNASMQTATMINPNADLTSFKLLAIVPTLVTIGSLIIAYIMGGVIGLFGVFLGFVSGLMLIHNSYLSIILLIAGMVAAHFAIRE